MKENWLLEKVRFFRNLRRVVTIAMKCMICKFLVDISFFHHIQKESQGVINVVTIFNLLFLKLFIL